MSDPNPDFDGGWKETVEVFLQPFINLLLPAIDREIDWCRGFDFLDSELRSLFPKAGSRRRRVDKLVRVFLRDGRAQWIYLHLEIQSQPSRRTPDRMFRYYCRIYDQYRKPILSVAILADPVPSHRPGHLDLRIAGSGCLFQYHVCKLTDFSDEFLEASTNPVAKVILAHRIAQRTAKDPVARMQAKVRWFRELLLQRFTRRQIKNLFRALEAMNPLPEQLDVEFRNQVRQCDPHKTMPIITSFERLARKEGLAEGHSQGLSQGLSKGLSTGLSQGRAEGQLAALRDAIRDLLEERFGHTPPAIGEHLQQESNPLTLRSWLRKTATIRSLEAFQHLMSR